MYPNSRLSENLAVLATIDPVSQGAGTVATGWVPLGKFARLVAVLQTGVLGAAATVDAKLQQATSSGGAGAKDIANKAITQIVKATGDNKQVEVDLRDDEVDVNNGFAYVRLSVTVGTAASLIAAGIYGAFPRNGLASDVNQAAVVQIVP